MISTSLSIAPGWHVAARSAFADPDGPLWFSRDRDGGSVDGGSSFARSRPACGMATEQAAGSATGRRDRLWWLPAAAAVSLMVPAGSAVASDAVRRAGIVIGILPAGPLNAITDVPGVMVGQVTIERGKDVHTGVTAILPHAGNLFQEKVPAGIVVANGFGKFAGSTQVEELGEIETPVLLTNTLSVPEAMAASIEWTLAQPGNEDVRSVNAVVGETNDGLLNDIRGRHVRIADARRAIETARTGPVAEGNVGAGTGTVAFGWKGGIGSASRRLPASLGGWTIGVLVQANYGGVLTIDGASVGTALDRYDYQREVEERRADGSVIVVVATDAPMSDRNLRRLAARAFAGVARTGSSFSNGSGDYAIAFSTASSVRRKAAPGNIPAVADLPNAAMSPAFQAAAEATEEAVLNALFSARTTVGHRGTAEALPHRRVLPLLRSSRTPLRPRRRRLGCGTHPLSRRRWRKRPPSMPLPPHVGRDPLYFRAAGTRVHRRGSKLFLGAPCITSSRSPASGYGRPVRRRHGPGFRLWSSGLGTRPPFTAGRILCGPRPSFARRGRVPLDYVRARPLPAWMRRVVRDIRTTTSRGPARRDHARGTPSFSLPPLR